MLYNRRTVKSWAKSQIPLLFERRVSIALLILAAFLLYLFRHIVEALFVMLIFIILGVLSMMYNRWVKVSLGVELIMLGMVVTGLVYGRLAALIVGIAGLFFAEVLTNRFTYSTSVSFLGVFAVSMVVPSMDPTNVTSAGIWMTLLYDAIILPGYILMGSSIWRSLLFGATHIAFNVWLFIVIAPPIVRLLA